MPTTTDRRPKRRTQAERTAATKAALLQSTLESVVEHGYAGVTTAEVAKRAGVTRGAQAHHFTDKEDLVVQAVLHLAQKLAAEYSLEVSPRTRTARSVERILDSLWQVHKSPLFAAALELGLAARTDPELREPVRDMDRDSADRLAGIFSDAVAGVLPRATVRRLTSSTLATIRGLVLLSFLNDDVDVEWRFARRELLRMWREHVEAATSA
jgi:AcrR family transcriptional regulator